MLQDQVIVLDERGKDITSEGLANLIAKVSHFLSHRNLSLVVGRLSVRQELGTKQIVKTA
jgi:23S rRNA pseudoU1915 N3-methylase RlmH